MSFKVEELGKNMVKLTIEVAAEEFEKAMNESVANAKENFLEEQVFESVKLKKGKLTLTNTDEKGKKQSDTYTFVE